MTVGLGLLLSGGAVVSSRAADAGTVKKLHGNMPSVVSKLQAEGDLPAATELHLAIGLPLRNGEALTNLLEQIYDPASTNYHRYLTPEQFTEQFGPSEQDYARVAEFVQANGLTVTHSHSNRMLLDVRGKASDIGKAFHTTLRTYRHPKENRVFFAPDTDPAVDAALPILSVQGMNNYQPPQPLSKRMSASGATPASGSSPGGGYIGKDFRNAYLPGSTLNGSGQIVGLLQFDGYLASDIATYMSIAGYTNVPLENVLLDGFNGFPGINNGEVCLDIEACIAMAPGLAKVVVFEAGPFGNPNDILSSMVSRSEIKQFSASWGYSTDAISQQLYQQMALQGQTFFNASGDGDAWVGPIPYGSCESPNITIVGGTTLTMNGLGLSYVSEVAWNWGFIGNYSWNPAGYFGSSGGISTTVPIPSWQKSVSMTNNHGSTVFRNVPDIALTADNVFVVSDGGSQGLFGGTSCASPLWAGFMALVNQQAVANGKPPVGFLAPAVYALAQTTSYANSFHDTTVGNNTWSGSPTNFFAVPGYDLATGLGTPNGTNFINALTGVGVTNTVTHLSPPPAPYGSTLSTLNGGNPNGSWYLFIQDDRQPDSGSVSNGWVLNLTTANPVGYSANSALSMAVSTTNTVEGGTVVYTIGVTNYGPSTSSNSIVTDTLSSGVTLISTTVSQGSVNGLNWNIGTLTSGAGAQLTLTVQPISPGLMLNSAIVNATTPDPNPTDNSRSVYVNVATILPPSLSGGSVSGGGTFSMAVTGAPVPTIIQGATNLVSPIWISIVTNTPPFLFTDPSAGSYPYRFYRAVTAAP